MKNKTRYVIPLLLIVLLLSFIVQRPLNSGKINFYHENSVMKDIKIKKIIKDSVRWVANIKEAKFTGNEDIAYLKKVSIYYPEKNFKLISESGIYNIKKGAIKLDNSVKGYSQKLQLETSKLRYNPDNGIISANNGVIIKGKKITITGNRARLKDKNKVEIEGNVKTIFK